MNKKINIFLIKILLIISIIFTNFNFNNIYADELKENDYLYNLYTQQSLQSVIGFSWGNEDIAVQVRTYGDKVVFCIEPGNPTNLNIEYKQTYDKPALYKDGLNLDAAINVMMMWNYKYMGDLKYTYAEFTAVQIAIWAAEVGRSPSMLTLRSGLSENLIKIANDIKTLAVNLYNERNNDEWKGDIQLYNLSKEEYITNSDYLSLNTDYIYTIDGVKYFMSDIYGYKGSGCASLNDINVTTTDDSDIKNIVIKKSKNVLAIYVPVSEIVEGSGTKYLKVKFNCGWNKYQPLYFDSDISQAFMTIDKIKTNKDTTLSLTVVKEAKTYEGTVGKISWNIVGEGPTSFKVDENINNTGEKLYKIDDWKVTSLRKGDFTLMNYIPGDNPGDPDDNGEWEPFVSFTMNSQGYLYYNKENLNDLTYLNDLAIGETKAPTGYVLVGLTGETAGTTEEGNRILMRAYAFDKSQANTDNVVLKNNGEPYKIQNVPKTIEIKLNKKDQNGNNVKGAVYGLYSTEDIVIGGTYDIPEISTIPANSLVDIATTDSSGNLTLGENVPVTQNYIVREIESPVGYDLNPTDITIDLTEFIADQSDTAEALSKTITLNVVDNKYSVGDIKTTAYTTFIKNVVNYNNITKLKTIPINEKVDVYDIVNITDTSIGSYKLIGNVVRLKDKKVISTSEEFFDITDVENTTVKMTFKDVSTGDLGLDEKVVITEKLYRLQYKWNSELKTVETNYVLVGEHEDFTDADQTLTTVGYGNIEITKTDETGSNKLAKAKFQLIYNDEINLPNPTIVAEATTGEDGKALMKNIASGDYYLIETEAPLGYVKESSPIEINLKVTENEKTTVSKLVKNTQSEYIVKLIKTDADKKEIPVAGAKYGLYNSSTSHLEETVTTDVRGIAIFSNLTHDVKYYISEISAPSGYVMNNARYTFTVNDSSFKFDGSTGIKTYVIETTDKKEVIDGTILVKKTDESGKVLKNAVFYLYKNKADAQKLLTPNEASITNSSGEVRFTGLDVDTTYYIVEFEAPSGYKRDTTVHEVKTKAKEVVTITIKNKKESTPTPKKDDDPPKVPNTGVK